MQLGRSTAWWCSLLHKDNIIYIKRLEVLARRSRLYWRVQNPCNVSMWTGMWSRYLSRWSAKLWLGAGGGDHGNSYGSLLSSSWLWLLSIISQHASSQMQLKYRDKNIHRAKRTLGHFARSVESQIMRSWNNAMKLYISTKYLEIIIIINNNKMI